MKRYVPQQPQAKPDVSVAKARLRVAAVQAAPSAFIRSHPLSTVIGTAAATFSLTAIAKLFYGGSSSESSASDRPDTKRPKRSSGSSVPWTLLRSILHMGLPIIQSQLTRHFVSREHDQHQQEQYASASGAQERAHVVD